MEKRWTIQEIAAETGLSTHTLRYYEKFGLLMGVDRDENGYRQYAETDRQWIEFLIRLRETGMSMRDMKQFSDLRNQGDPTVRARRELLQAHRQKVTEQIAELMENLAVIDDKIEYYALLEEGKDEVKKATQRKNR
ncbi:MerR family transcriptional regulator [Paenibacillus sp. GCM10027628]|uniref:MerR family transcriptional regulator n=1 Tax=Paenibacillus sp. GCM10027628 TaxID=3273413 RepID=UPI00362B3BFB